MRYNLVVAVTVWLGAAAPATALQAGQPSAPAAAPAAQPSQALRMRAEQVVEMFNGQRTLQDFFGPAVPVERYNSNLTAVRERFGPAVRVTALEANTPNSGIVTVDFERGQRRWRLRVADEPPHAVNDFGPAR